MIRNSELFYDLGDNVDFNNLIQNGFYTGKFSEHTPDGTTAGYWNVEVSLFDNNVNYVYQKACKANSNIYYSRYYDDQGWSDWDSFATNTDLYKSVSINSSTNILTLLPGFYKFEGDTGTMLASNGFPFDNISYDNVSIFIWGDYTDENNGYKVIDLFYQGRRFVRRQSWNTWGEWKEYTLTTLT